ncbi:FAD-binding oxidoreductase [Janibacter sp. GXQ6167]|uniref:FAD-binding oxidoreductase n=1 Tax=Janibacter sp. GXQ6167 TaxID=3240791 RepID=UPI0035232F2B
MSTHLISRLTERLGSDRVVTDADVLAAHASDRAVFAPTGRPLALLRARTVEQVSTALAWAHEHRVPVVPQGARTGLSGGANAIDGALLLSVEGMDRILRIDPVEQIAVVEPGVINATLTRAAEEHGLTYLPDPSSWEISTIGGNVATNAGGLCCVKYGVTRDFVRGLQVVLADGRIMRTGRATAKGVAGYDLTALFVGSEGTLGVITEVTLALRPKPAPALTAAAYFGDVVEACQVVTEVMSSGVRPSLLELMDGPSLEVVSRLQDLGFPPGTDGLLICSSDDPDRQGTDLQTFARIAEAHGGEVVIAEDVQEAELLIQARRLVNPAHAALGTDLVDDVCVPRGRLVDLLRGVREIAARYDVLVTTAGHAGDGNMHPSVVFDASDPDQTERAQAAFGAIMQLGIDLGGTITGEHGVGRLKSAWLGRELDPAAMATQRAIKAALDPRGILNPGSVLSPAADDLH